jgi:hypothetical protein
VQLPRGDSVITETGLPIEKITSIRQCARFEGLPLLTN